jgi:alpha/beta superfamily hydrolase
MTVQARDVMIPVGEISLQGKLGCRQNTAKGPAVVICHPHPQMGGTMDNNVVWALFDAFVERGYVAVAFNFRGVGSSGGRHEEGEGEVLDVLGVLDWLETLPETKGCGLGILGYSFGAWVGLRAAVRDDRVRCVGAVAPPLAMYSFSFLKELDRPLFVVSGGQDMFCPLEGKEALCSELAKEVNWKIVEGTDHFFWSSEKEAAGYLADGFDRFLRC